MGVGQPLAFELVLTPPPVPPTTPHFLSYRSSKADLCPRSLLAGPVGEVGRTGAGVGEGSLQLIKFSSFLAQSRCCSSLLFIFRGGVGKGGGLSESLLFIYIYMYLHFCIFGVFYFSHLFFLRLKMMLFFFFFF